MYRISSLVEFRCQLLELKFKIRSFFKNYFLLTEPSSKRNKQNTFRNLFVTRIVQQTLQIILPAKSTNKKLQRIHLVYARYRKPLSLTKFSEETVDASVDEETPPSSTCIEANKNVQRRRIPM